MINNIRYADDTLIIVESESQKNTSRDESLHSIHKSRIHTTLV